VSGLDRSVRAWSEGVVREITDLDCSCRRASVLPVNLLVTLILRKPGAGRTLVRFRRHVEGFHKVAARRADLVD
jgi:hypothetical protein